MNMLFLMKKKIWKKSLINPIENLLGLEESKSEFKFFGIFFLLNITNYNWNNFNKNFEREKPLDLFNIQLKFSLTLLGLNTLLCT